MTEIPGGVPSPSAGEPAPSWDPFKLLRFPTVQAGALPSLSAARAAGDMDAEARQRLIDQYRTARVRQPGPAREYAKLSQELGVEPHLLEAADALKYQQDLDFADYVKRMSSAPFEVGVGKDFNFLVQTQDDADTIERINHGWGWIDANWERGELIIERGELGAKLWASGQEKLEAKDQERLDWINRRLKLPINNTGLIGALGDGAEVLGQMSKALVYGFAGGGAGAALGSVIPGVGTAVGYTVGQVVGAFTTTAQSEGGNAYLDFLERGYDQDSARFAAFGVGVLNGVLEAGGIGKAMGFSRKLAPKLFGKAASKALAQNNPFWSGLAKEYLGGIGAEVGTEIMQEVTQITADRLLYKYSPEELKAKLADEMESESIAGQILDIATKTFKAMMVIGLPPAVARAAVDSSRGRSGRAAAEFATSLAENHAKLKAAGTVPEAIETMYRQLGDRTGVKEFVVNRDALTTILTQLDGQAKPGEETATETLRRLYPAIADEMGRAGEFVHIPTDVFGSRIGNTALGQALLDHLKLDEDGFSRAEEREYADEMKKAGVDAKLAERIALRQEERQQTAVVTKTIKQMLVAQGVYSSREAALQASFVTGGVVRLARDLGISVQEAWDKHGFTVAPWLTQAAAADDLMQRVDIDIDAVKSILEQGDAALAEAQAGAREGLQLTPEQKAFNEADAQFRAELKEKFAGFEAGVVSRAELRGFIDARKPVRPYTSVPPLPSVEQVMGALKGRAQVERMTVTPKQGERVNLRLDIPAYQTYGVWVPTVHKPTKSVSDGAEIGQPGEAYAQPRAVRVTNAVFGGFGKQDKGNRAATVIREGRKFSFAVVQGDYEAVSDEDVHALATEVLPQTLEEGSEWRQVGMDPTRRSFFYDRVTMEPIVRADEVLQVGSLILARNAETAADETFYFARSKKKAESLDEEAAADPAAVRWSRDENKNPMVAAKAAVSAVKGSSKAAKAAREEAKAALAEATRADLSLKDSFDDPAEGLRRLAALEAKHPNPCESPEAWAAFMADLSTTDTVPMAPGEAIKYANSVEAVATTLKEVTPQQRQARLDGFAAGAEVARAYASGEATERTTALTLVWAMLSKGVAASSHELGYLHLLKAGIVDWLDEIARGDWNAQSTLEYYEWYDSIMQELPRHKAVGSAGVNFKKVFAEVFLPRLASRQADGRTTLAHIHDLFANQELSGKEVRRRFFATIGPNAGLQSKVLDLALLAVGRTDTLIIDRVQANHHWGQTAMERAKAAGVKATKDDGGINLYNAFGGDLIGWRGVALYEALERSMAKNVQAAYATVYPEAALGDGTLGAWHWDTWQAKSWQAVSHPSMRTVDETVEPTPLLAIREAKYNTVSSGFEFRYDNLVQRKALGSDDYYVFTMAQHEKVLTALKKLIDAAGIKVSEQTAAPWYDNPAVTPADYDAILAKFGRRESPDVLLDAGVAPRSERGVSGDETLYYSRTVSGVAAARQRAEQQAADLVRQAVASGQLTEADAARAIERGIGFTRALLTQLQVTDAQKAWDATPVVDLRKLVGRKVQPTIADRTAAFGWSQGEVARRTADPIRQLGGPLYPLRQVNRERDIVWAVRGAATYATVANRIRNGATVIAVTLGSDEMLSSNTTVAGSYVQMIQQLVKSGTLNDEQMALINERLAFAVKQSRAAVAAPRLDHAHETEVADWLNALSFEVRAAVVNALGAVEVAAVLQVPPLELHNWELTEPRLRGERIMSATLLIEVDPNDFAATPKGKFDPSASTAFVPINTPEAYAQGYDHPDFPLGLKGKLLGRLPANTPLSALMPTAFADWQAKHAAQPALSWPYYVSKIPSEFASEPITQELADRLQPAMEKAGALAGRAARIYLATGLGRWHTSRDQKGSFTPDQYAKLMARAPGAVSLSPVDADFRKELRKGGKAVAYRLGENAKTEAFDVAFALEEGHPGPGYGLPELAKPGDKTLTRVVSAEFTKGSMFAVMGKALEEGVTCLDCFAVSSTRHPEGLLPKLYAEYGFVVEGTVPFEEKYYLDTAADGTVDYTRLDKLKEFWASQGWDPTTGYPPIVIMRWTGTDEQRADFTRRALADGRLPVGRGLPAGRAAEADHAEAARTAESGGRRKGRGDADAGAGVRPAGDRGGSSAARTLSNVRDIAGLTAEAARIAGVTPREVAEFAARVGVNPDPSITAAVAGPEADFVYRSAVPPPTGEGPQDGQGAPQGDDQTVRGVYSPSSRTIRLNPATATLSTFLHEASHHFLNIYDGLVTTGQAPGAIASRFTVLLDWFGISLDQWRALSPEGKRRYHEQFAYGFEQYLSEGTAPSSGLARIFGAFRRWLVDIYQGAPSATLSRAYVDEFGVEMPPLSDEVREVMAQMFDVEMEVERYRRTRGAVPLFVSQEQFVAMGGDPEDWDRYREAQEAADEEAVARVLARSLRDAAWVRNFRKATERRLRRQMVIDNLSDQLSADEAARLYDEVEMEAAQAMEDTPVYRLQRILREDRLSRSEAERLFPQGLPPGLERFLADDGQSAIALAEAVGEPNPVKLLTDLAAARPYSEELARRVTTRIVNRYSGLYDEAELQRQVDVAVHNEQRARAVATELALADLATTPERVMRAAARQAAVGVVGQTRIANLRRGYFANMERRVAAEAWRRASETNADRAAAARAGINPEARDSIFVLKRRQLMYHYAVGEADLAMQEVEAAQRSWRRLFRPDATAVRGNQLVYITAARHLVTLARGFGTTDEGVQLTREATARVEETVRQMRESEPELAAQYDAIVQGIQLQGDMTTFTVEQFRGFVQTVDHLVHAGRRAERVRLGDRDLALTEAHEALVSQLGPAADLTARPLGEQTPKELKRRALGGFFARWKRAENLFDQIDRGTGPWTQLVYRPLQKAIDHYRVKRQHYVGRYRDLFAQLGKLPPGEIQLRIGNRTIPLGRGNGGNGMAELLGVLLHSGNNSNLVKMLIGKRWMDATDVLSEDGTVNTRAFWDAITALEQAGTITAAHWQWVGQVWALMEEMKPLAQQAHRDLYGHYFTEIQRTPVERTLADGTVVSLPGGYVPSKLAPGSTRFEKLEGMDALRADERAGFPSTGRGFTISRVEQFRGDVSIDIRLINHHIDALLKFSILQPQLHEVMRTLNHRVTDENGARGPALSEQLDAARPNAMTSVIMPWLQRIASQSVQERSTTPLLDKWLNELRTRAGIGIMFANLSNAMQQMTGLFLSAVKIRPSHLLGSTMRYTRSPRRMANAIAQRSEFMRIALRDQMFDMMGQIEDLTLNPTLLHKSQKALRKEAYFLQSGFQNVVNLITWDAAFEQASRRGASEMEAIAEADSAVRLTQGTMNPETLSAGEAGPAWQKLLLQFTSYFNMMANLLLTEARKAIAIDGGVVAAFPALFRVGMLGFLLPTLVADLIARAMRGQLDDDDDDGYDDELASWLLVSPLSAVVQMVPFVGPTLGSAALRQFDDMPFNDRLGTPAAVATLESIMKAMFGRAKALASDEPGDAFDTNRIRDVVTGLSMALNLSALAALGRPLEYALDVEEERVEPYNGYDYARGLITGTAAEGTRK